MMTRTGADTWVDKYGWRVVSALITGLITIGGAYMTVETQITAGDQRTGARVDSLTVQLTRIERDMQTMARAQIQMHAYLCRGHEESIGCQP